MHPGESDTDDSSHCMPYCFLEVILSSPGISTRGTWLLLILVLRANVMLSDNDEYIIT